MEVECALLEGEQESEMAQLQRENELLDQLKEKIPGSEKKSHTEKSQVKIENYDLIISHMVDTNQSIYPSLGVQHSVRGCIQSMLAWGCVSVSMLS